MPWQPIQLVDVLVALLDCHECVCTTGDVQDSDGRVLQRHARVWHYRIDSDALALLLHYIVDPFKL